MKEDMNEAFAAFENQLTNDLGLSTQEADESGLSVKRNGNVTGSAFKKLMTCKSRKKGLNWTMHEKLVDFGDTAINYCLEKAIERMTGKRQNTAETWEMKWGTNYEPIAREEIFKKYGVPVPEQDFMYFLKNAGSTPDSFFESLAIPNSNFKYVNVNVEIKCPPKQDNHHKYMTQDADETHEYFWQFQGEMLSHSVHRKVICNKTAFFSYHPNFPDGYNLGLRIVEASEIHQTAMKIRCIIAERIIKSIMANFWERPQTFLPAAIADIPTNYNEILDWLSVNIKDLEICQ